MKKIKYLIVIFSSIILSILLIDSTKAKYYSLEFGDIGNVHFTPFSTFAEEFVITDEKLGDKDELVSDNLWGANPPPSGTNLNNYGEAYKIEQLENVAFSVRNATDSDITLSHFEFMIYTFQNSDYSLNFELLNTAKTDDYQNITGTVTIKGTTVSSYQFNDPSNPTDPDNLNLLEYVETLPPEGSTEPGIAKNYYTLTVNINPIKYYKRVTISGSEGNYTLDNKNADTKEGVPYVNDIEKENLETYFVLRPGQIFEFNIRVNVNPKNNNSGAKSVYSTIKMHAQKYDESSIN